MIFMSGMAFGQQNVITINGVDYTITGGEIEINHIPSYLRGFNSRPDCFDGFGTLLNAGWHVHNDVAYNTQDRADYRVRHQRFLVDTPYALFRGGTSIGNFASQGAILTYVANNP